MTLILIYKTDQNFIIAIIQIILISGQIHTPHLV